jgi:hypothetical protein
MEKLNGPLYGSWGEAMADPAFDPSKPWYVAPDPVEAPDEPVDWSGWTTIGSTDDGSTDDG